MSNTRLTGSQAVDTYFDSLLLDVSSSDQGSDEINTSVRLARVEPGYELQVLWVRPLNKAQQLCANFTLLSCLQKISGEKLRRCIIQAISINGC